MRVPVDRQPIRARGDHRVERAPESFECLFRQAVNQIDVDRAQSAGAAGIDDAQRFFDRLHAVDRRLHDRIEILHAEAGAVETDPSQPGDVVGRDETRIQLDGKIAIGARAEGEVVRERIEQFTQLRGGEEIRRPAAQMQLHHFAIAVECRRERGDLAQEPAQVCFAPGDVARDDARAAAIEARAHAIRHVHVQRQRARDRVAVAGPDLPVQGFDIEAAVEMRSRGIGRVTRPGAIVAP
jgi:hypothetical protein